MSSPTRRRSDDWTVCMSAPIVPRAGVGPPARWSPGRADSPSPPLFGVPGAEPATAEGYTGRDMRRPRSETPLAVVTVTSSSGTNPRAS